MVQKSKKLMSAVDPGYGLGIAALILAFYVSPVGLILGIVGLVKSKKAGFKNGFALAGIIIGALSMAVTTIIIVSIVTPAVSPRSQFINSLNEGYCKISVNGVMRDCNF